MIFNALLIGAYMTIVFTWSNNVFYALTFCFIRCSSCKTVVVFLLCGKASPFHKSDDDDESSVAQLTIFSNLHWQSNNRPKS